jgi:cell division protein FtsI (penicillin-binding protein 3)
MAHSSNVCAIKTALSVGQVPFYEMVRKMGFGSETGVELPAETKGIVRPIERWNGDSLASMAIGYEIGVTALQMTSAFATIANNGIRLQPRIVKEIRSSDQQLVRPSNPLETQVVTAATAKNLKTMLRQVVVAGTGRRAQLNGYSAAGKTGTAWKFDEVAKRVDSSKYISSFIGMAPADDPEIVVAVVMDEPVGGARDGGMVSAPVFREISQNVLMALKIAPDEPIRPDAVGAQLVPSKPTDTTVATNPVDSKLPKDIKPSPRSTPVVPPAAKQNDVKKGTEKKTLREPKLTASHWLYHDFPRLRPRKIKLET